MTTKTALTLNQAYAKQLIGTWPTSYYTGATEIEYLIVAGGGGSSGGNGEPAGGGGAGGVLTGTYMVSNFTNFTDIEVGAGGARAADGEFLAFPGVHLPVESVVEQAAFLPGVELRIALFPGLMVFD